MATYTKLIHNGKIQTVALMEGLELDEVTSLLKTVFGINGNIVGIMAEKGLVIPMSLVCKSPQIIPNSTCKILIAKSADSQETSKSVASVPAPQQAQKNAITQVDDESSDEDEDEAAAQSVVNEIDQFLDTLRSKNVLNNIQHQLLHRLLNERSALLFAAYSVAVSAGDPEYLTEICKDIATSLQSDEGRTACEAQDEVLQVCDQLYLQRKITESQLLYLRHLTLIRDSSIASVYDEFQEHNSVTLFAKSLYDVANSHPFRSGESPADGEEDDDEEEDNDEDDEDDDDEDGDEQDEEMRQDFSSGLIGVIVVMLRSEILSRTEAQVLLEMVQREDDYVLAAYELYLRDNNMEDLQDTLMRCVRLEIRKRVTDIQERELATLQRERDLEKAGQDNSATYDEATDADEEDDVDVDSEDYESGKAVATREFGLEAISLDSLLNELGIENQWKGHVPDQFVQAVFIAVFRKHLSLNQACSLCDLFQANYDMVHAAWEVYVVQKDTVDFIDTLRRISDADLQEDQQSESSAGQEASQASSNAAQEARQQSASTGNDAIHEARSKAKEVEEAKSKALHAISEAKSELLKHSLDMMVKQNMVSEKSADDLYQRHLEGDKLTDAAIEAYAADRDVNEFVDTLQMLASHSKEELDILMGSAIAEQENRESTEATAATTATSSAAADTESAIAQRYLADAALHQIEEIVSEMLKNDMISPPVASAFARLITDRDPRLVEAYQQFMKSRNGTELIDTLLKVVIASVQSGLLAANATAAAPAPAAKPTPAAATPPSGAQVLDKTDQKQIADILFQSNALSAHQYNDICRMIEEGDASISRIFRKYEATKDVMYLVQDLQVLNRSNVGRESSAANSTSAVAATDDGDDDDDDEDDDDDVDQQAESVEDDETPRDSTVTGGNDEDDEGDERLDEEDARLIERRFMQIIQNMALSELEQTALRLAIAENDPAIRNAIDAFRRDLDEERLVVSMRNAARAVIHRTLSNASRAEDDEEDDDENNGSDDDDEEDQEDDDDEQDGDDEDQDDDDEPEDNDDNIDELVQLNRALYSNTATNGDEDDDEDEDDAEEEEDEDDGEYDDDEDLGEPGVSLITSKAARDHVFPILVQELMKETIISRRDGSIIMQQFASNNPIISTALDRYDTNNDMAMLVDALQQMVENIQNDST